MIAYLKNIFSKKTYSIGSEEYTEKIIEYFYKKDKYYSKKDVVCFKDLNAFGSFKYDAVKSILQKNEIFGVSSVHLFLNDIYFSNDEKKHIHNKKSILQYFDFLSTDIKIENIEFIDNLFNILYQNIPKNKKIDVVYYVINPLVFIYALYNFRLFEMFPMFDIENEQFSIDHAIKMIDEYFEDNEKLEIYIKGFLDKNENIPTYIKELLKKLKTNNKITNERVSKFLKSMIFTAIESTAGFISLLLFSIFQDRENYKKVSENESLFDNYANEILRIFTPVPFIYRTIQKDIIYQNTRLKKGELLIVFLGAANLDPKQFKNPKKIILDRPNTHLSFGRGRLSCVGKNYSFNIAKKLFLCFKQKEIELNFLNKKPILKIHNSMLKLTNFNVIADD